MITIKCDCREAFHGSGLVNSPCGACYVFTFDACRECLLNRLGALVYVEDSIERVPAKTTAFLNRCFEHSVDV